ncbi:MAG: MopE-related protein, partial [Myxococcota bacterium]|nr:MopE-related protein [Myxococcota bacterium]
MQVRIGRLVLLNVLAWGPLGCSSSDSGGSVEAEQQRDMFIRSIVQDATIEVDMVTQIVDATTIIKQCEPGETRVCSKNVGACREGVNRCTEDGLWNSECEGGVEPLLNEAGEPHEVCDEIDNDCDELVDEGIRLGGTCKTADDKEGKVYCNPETKQPYCRPDRDCSPDEDADGANVCEDCDDNDKNNFPGNDELCDDQDNDCDDKTDEGFILG